MDAQDAFVSYHHGNLRSELLKRAQEVLPETGIDGLSLRQLARDVGVSSAAPRRHFSDRAALLDALALAGFSELDSLMGAAPDTADFRRDVQAMFEAYLNFAVANPALLELMFARKYNDATIQAAVHRLLRRSIAIIERAQERGEIKSGDADAIGTACFTPVHGIAMLVGSALLSKEEMHTALADVLTIVVDGLQPT